MDGTVDTNESIQSTQTLALIFFSILNRITSTRAVEISDTDPA